jgi:hypothetical protein
MRNQRLKDLLVFVLLFIPALLVAWFHYTCFPTVIDGFHQWDATRPLSEGIELLRQFGFILYLPPLAIFALYLLSWRFATLRSPVIISLCGGLMVTLCFIYTALLVTPAWAHAIPK